jgi:hypothetical protein
MRKLLYLFVLVTIVVYFVRRNTIKLDGISGEILGLITDADTKYSLGYSHNKFAQIKIGMTEKEVMEIIGEPLVRWKPYKYSKYKKDKGHYVGLQYSESPSDTHYRIRQVYLDNGKVAEIISYYYID